MKKIGKISIIAAIVLLITVLAAGAFAEFTRSYRAKRVVAAYEPAGLRFSSNILEKTATIVSHAKFVDKATADAIKNGGNPVVSEIITVCNFPQDNTTMIYPQRITYIMKARLVALVNNVETAPTGSYSVSVSDGTNTWTVNATDSEQQLGEEFALSAGIKDTHEYTVTFDDSMLTSTEKVFLKLSAVPTVQYSDINESSATLSAYLHIAEMPLSVATGWTLSQTDDMSDVTSDQNYFGNYYGYNYRLSGTGEGEATIKWDSTKLAINEIFPEQVYAWVKEAEGQKAYDKVIETAWQTAYNSAISGNSTEEQARTAADAAAAAAVTAAEAARTAALATQATENKAEAAKTITKVGNIWSMTIPVDSDYRNNYEIVFYPANGDKTLISSLDNLRPAAEGTVGSQSYIQYSYTETF